jgi:hypothetical protein
MRCKEKADWPRHGRSARHRERELKVFPLLEFQDFLYRSYFFELL